MNVRLILSALFLVLFALPGNAQLLNKLKKAAQDGVEKAVERRVSQEIENAAARQTDRYLNEVFGPPSQANGSGADYSKILSGMSADVDTEDSYSFTGYTDMLITGTNEKGKEIDPTKFRAFLNPENEYWGMEMENNEKDLENAIMLFDQPNQATIMLMTDKKGEKSRIAYRLDWDQMMEEGMDEQMNSADSTFNLTRTGNTKTLLGYLCDEYVSEGSGYTSTLWISQEPIEGYASYWSGNNFLFTKRMAQKYPAQFDQLPEGNVLEINYLSKDSKEATHMTVTEINTDRQVTYTLEDYTDIMQQEKE